MLEERYVCFSQWECTKQSLINACSHELSVEGDWPHPLLSDRITKFVFLTVKMEFGKFVNGSGISKCERLRAARDSIMSPWRLMIPSQDSL